MLTWYSENWSEDGMLGHPSYSQSWKVINNLFFEFASDPWNLNVTIDIDGINSCSFISSRYSFWFVIMIRYNLSLCCIWRGNLWC